MPEVWYVLPETTPALLLLALPAAPLVVVGTLAPEAGPTRLRAPRSQRPSQHPGPPGRQHATLLEAGAMKRSVAHASLQRESGRA